MVILAIDTATDAATAALVLDGEVLGERRSRAVTILEDCDALLRQGGVHDRDSARSRSASGRVVASRARAWASRPSARSPSHATCPSPATRLSGRRWPRAPTGRCR